MNPYEWFDSYCMGKPGVTKDYKEEWAWDRYFVGGKTFGIVGHGEDGEETILTLKCEPEFGQFLRGQYPGVTAGYYMNKEHWNTVWFDREKVPDEVVREMVDRSYRLVFAALPKREREKIVSAGEEKE